MNNKPTGRIILLYALLGGAFFIIDLSLDRFFGERGNIDIPHIVLAALAVLTSYILLSLATENRRHAEVLLRQSRDELEVRVKNRTSELEQTNQTLSTLIQTLPVGLIIVDTGGHIVLANPLARSILGEMLTGDTYNLENEPNLYRSDDTLLPVAERPLNRAIQQGKTTTSVEVHLHRADGSSVSLLMAASPVRDENGRIISAVKIVQDITELKRMEQALGTSEETARALINSLTESALLLDPQGTVLAANETAARRLGVTVSTMIGTSLFDLFSQEVSDRRRNYLQEVLQTRGPAHYEDIRDGRQYDIHIYPVCDENGNVIRLAVFGEDVTERRHAEQALRESEERYRSQFDNFSEPVTVWDRNGILLMQNLVSAKNLGGKREEYIGKTIFDIFGDAAHTYYLRMMRVIESGLTEYQEDVSDTVFGQRYFWTSMQHVQNPDGQEAVQIISYDITDRKKAEEALRSSEEKFASVFNSSPVSIGIIRLADETFLDVNEAFTKTLGYSRAEANGMKWRNVVPIQSEAWRDDFTEQFRSQGKVTDYEISIFNRNGQTITLLLSLISITLGGESCILAFAHDITERKKSEEALRQAQEELARGIQVRATLEERQRLARELHDSVSQALYGISLGAHTALALFDTDRAKVLEALNYVVALVQDGLTEMRALIFELRPESLEREGLVTALNKQMAALCARHDIEAESSLCEEPEISLNVKEALFRVAQEAMQNAIKHARARHLNLELVCYPDYLRLAVTDDGIGFDPQAEYPGHLGLRSMRERVCNLGGSLDIASAPEHGTQINVRIPISAS